MYLILSWRNIWRNKKRTIIVAASVFFAVLLSALMRSGQLGSYSYMIHSSAKLFTGYLQIQGNEYWEKRSLDESIIVNPFIYTKLDSVQYLTHYTPRLEAFALISHDSVTKVSQVIGIDPKLENAMTDVFDKLIRGKPITHDSRGLMVGSGLADMLGADLGDSLVVYGQGYHGQIAAAILPVTGIIKLPFKAMDNGMILMSLATAQEVFSCPDRITSLPIMIEDNRFLDEVQADIKSLLDQDQVIMSWEEMMPELLQNIEVDNVSGIIMLAILYVVIAFGVFGTVMMMVSERARELAILVSLGMRKRKLLMIMAIETFLLSFVGVITGIIGSIPLIYYLVYNPIELTGGAAELYDQLSIEPIMTFSAQPAVFISQAIVVFIIALVTIIYPILFIRNMDPARTIRG
jgi:ABC-type lipoprotein release transport system permease subunit